MCARRSAPSPPTQRRPPICLTRARACACVNALSSRGVTTSLCLETAHPPVQSGEAASSPKKTAGGFRVPAKVFFLPRPLVHAKRAPSPPRSAHTQLALKVEEPSLTSLLPNAQLKPQTEQTRVRPSPSPIAAPSFEANRLRRQQQPCRQGAGTIVACHAASYALAARMPAPEACEGARARDGLLLARASLSASLSIPPPTLSHNTQHRSSSRPSRARRSRSRWRAPTRSRTSSRKFRTRRVRACVVAAAARGGALLSAAASS